VQFCTILVFLLTPVNVSATTLEEPSLLTFPPVFDYRSDPGIDYRSLNIAGPILKYERKQSERDLALRPLFYFTSDKSRGAAQLEILYPLVSYKHDKEVVSYRILILLSYFSNQSNSSSQRNFALFPLLFYKEKNSDPRQYAVFPLIGHYYNWLNRDEISYVMFPLYSHTKRHGTYVDNYLWPFFARISGDSPAETGFKIWPLYGYSEKPGVYQKRMFLWPLWISEDLQQNSDNPISLRYSFPLYLHGESPLKSRRTFLWPFFSYVDDRKNGYIQWTFPWPLFSYTKGEHWFGYKALPLISDMTVNSKRTRNFLWPLFRIEDQQFSTISQHRTRVLFFLFTNLVELNNETGQQELHRRLFWPLFGYRQENGVSHFYTLALLEPIFQHSDGIIRNWSPLWRIYQRKWDDQGNCVSSFLWNIFWHERSKKGVAWELFPLFSYRHETEVVREWSILKGLITVKNKNQDKRLHLFYLPWGLPLGESEL
jgi:hypothetical protein